MAIPIVLLIVVLFVVIAILAHIAEKKRREQMRALAARLGLSYSPDADYSLAQRVAFLDQTQQGDDRYASDVLAGTYRGHAVKAFNFHYETHSRDSKGKRTTQDHWLSFFVVDLPRKCPELLIGAEGFFSKIAQAFGYDDIDFESHEFSRKFCVRCPDKKFAYDICHTRMMEYLLANPDLTIEIENHLLAIVGNSVMRMDNIEHELNRLIELREMMPAYLFEPGAS